MSLRSAEQTTHKQKTEAVEVGARCADPGLTLQHVGVAIGARSVESCRAQAQVPTPGAGRFAEVGSMLLPTGQGPKENNPKLEYGFPNCLCGFLGSLSNSSTII